MSADDRWTQDGHVLVVDSDECARVECPPGGCRGPYLTCNECQGQGDIEDGDGELVECRACRGTRMDAGEHSCYLAADSFDPRDALWDPVPPPGRYPIAYSTDGHHEQFEATLKLVSPAEEGTR
jgi:hypothetical protein